MIKNKEKGDQHMIHTVFDLNHNVEMILFEVGELFLVDLESEEKKVFGSVPYFLWFLPFEIQNLILARTTMQ